MKKSFKKLVCLGLVVTLAASMFAACGSNDDNKKKDATKFYIGGTGPLTGGAAIYGNAVKNAAQIAVDEINAAGGINGCQIEFKFVDDEHDAEKAVSGYNVLKDWGIQIMMGSVTSGPCTAVADKTSIDGIFQLTPSGSSTECVTNDNVFQVCFTDPNQGSASAKYIAENEIAKKVAVIYDSSTVYSTGIYETFKKQAEADKKFEIVTTQSFTTTTNTDFSVQLTAAKEAGAELIFLPIYYSEASTILTQAAGMDYKPTFFGCDGMDGILGVENFDTKLAEGLLLLTPFAADATDAKTVAFVKKYKEKHNNEVPNQFAADAYDAMYILKAAIEKAGVKPDMDEETMCEKIAKAMTEIKVDGLTGEGMTWVKTGEVNKAPKAVVIKDGVYVSYTK